MIKNTKYKRGFTLIELLVVVAILGILASVGLGQFFTAQKRGRDTQRKESLASIARALEMYYNDYKQYPLSTGGNEGKIAIPGGETIDWGGEFTDGKTTYMKQLPEDPADNAHYFYMSTDGTSFKLYAWIEHENDSCFLPGGACEKDGYFGTNCGAATCNYCLASANTTCGE
ncbi:MAG: type II secretion system protein [Candidatus Omnitrophica bacterium]|nr:type II secretion system protein [Candidatus Omnitrophota bacterium]